MTQELYDELKPVERKSMKQTVEEIMQIKLTLEEALQEIKDLQRWVDDLQSGMYINCVYCGHQYGPALCPECKGYGNKYKNDIVVIGDTCTVCNGTGKGVPVTMADVLKKHIAVCPKHPMSALRQALIRITDTAVRGLRGTTHPSSATVFNEIKNEAQEAIRNI